jgi:hypothetical protein
MITPTVGRVVWFWPMSATSPKGAEGAQPLAATVAYVHNDTCVNLTVHERGGETYGLQAVLFWQGEGESPDHPHCEWMPYQKGQAAKTEALEAQVKGIDHHSV